MSLKKLLPILFVVFSFTAKANYMLVQNVTKLGNNPTNKTIQIQFDLSWQNSWRDSINWDAAWIFIKFKDVNGLWQHARINLSGFANGAGTSNTIKVGSDSVGAFVYRSALGSGNFNATSMQLQWNYGASGLTDGSGLEVRVFATEMVYVPEGEFIVAKGFSNDGQTFKVFSSPGDNFPVINQRISPVINYNDGLSINIRIKGDAGIDTNNDGIIDNISYPIGYKSFYSYKYEMSEQQYADFLNTLTAAQKATLGVAGSGITLNNGAYFSSTPNKACGNSNEIRLLSYADWSGLRPMSILEYNKASYGPRLTFDISLIFSYEYPNFFFNDYSEFGYPSWGSNSSMGYNLENYTDVSNYPYRLKLIDVGYLANSNPNRTISRASYYGVIDLSLNATDPVVKMNYYNFSIVNGNGALSASGNADVANWNGAMIVYINNYIYRQAFFSTSTNGFRYVRSAE